MNLAQNDARSPRLLTTFRQPMEAEQLANQLRENGIEALTTGAAIATGAIEFAQVDVEVLVPSDQLDQARKVLADSQATPPINWDEVDCHEDGQSEVSEDSFESDIARLSYTSNWSPGIRFGLALISVISIFVWAAFIVFAP